MLRKKKKLNFAIEYAENTIRIYDFLTTDTPKYMYLYYHSGMYENIHRPRSFNFMGSLSLFNRVSLLRRE